MNKFGFQSFFMFFIIALSSYAETISTIRVISSFDQELYSKELVLANMILQKGDEFSPSNLSKAIKKLYATKKFDDIEARVEPSASGGVDIVFTVTPKPIVDDVIFKGNKLISTKKLLQKISHEKGITFDEKKLSEDLQNLYESYHKKGYHESHIKEEVAADSDSNTVTITYKINEEGRYKTRSLYIIGNFAFSDRQLKKMIETKVSYWGYIFPVGYFNENDLKNDQDLLRQVYWSKGFLDFKIKKVDQFYDADRKKTYLSIYIDEGSQYSVKEVNISGNDVFSKQEIEELVSLSPNQDYNQEIEQRDITKITERYNRKGYLDCYVRAKKSINSAAHTIAIDYSIQEGLPFTIRDVHISGNHITKDEVVRRELSIHPGDLGDITRINASKSSLLNLGYFETVDIIPVSTTESDKKDLNLKVEEKLTGQLLFGAGFSSTDNILGTAEISQSNFDLFNFPSFRGGGQRFRLRLQTGSSRSDFTLSFTEPWLMDRPLRLDFEAWDRTTSSNRDYDQDSNGTSIRITRRMRRPFWRQSFGYRLENIDINDIDTAFSQSFFEEEEGNSLVSALSLGFTRDHRDRIFFTSSGSRFSINAELQPEFLGSYTNLYKLTLSLDKYFPVFKKAVFKLSGEIGQVSKISGDQPRIFDRFFAGGASSIRGFRERDVGPIDSPTNDEPVGGRSILLGSAELTGPVYEKTIFWATFVDSGNVWENSSGWNVSELNVGVGIGIRLFLPIGAIQLDYGWPVARDQGHLSSSGRFHFNLGYNF